MTAVDRPAPASLSAKGRYVQALRAGRRGLDHLGGLALLDRWARRSRAGTWARSLLAVYDLDDLRTLDVPWWTFDAADQVAAFLASRPGARVLEWGSGASTFWLAARAGQVVSIEHDPQWGDEVAAAAPANVEVRTVEPAPVTGPGAVTSAKQGFEGLDFAAYVAEADRVPGRFDLIVVDGRAREACLARAVDRLTPGGLIVFDNVDRARYTDAIAAFGARLAVTTTRGLTPCLPYPTRTALIRVRAG